MFLIAAFAIPCASLAIAWSDKEYSNIQGQPIRSGRPTSRQLASFYVHRMFLDSVAFLSVTSVALVCAVPLSRDASRLHTRQSAGRTAIVLTATVSLIMGTRHLIWWSAGGVSTIYSLWYRVGNNGAAELLCGWSLLAAIGRCQNSKDPADIPGRILGWCWLGLAVTYWIAWAVVG